MASAAATLSALRQRIAAIETGGTPASEAGFGTVEDGASVHAGPGI